VKRGDIRAGERFGALVVIAEAERYRYGHRQYLCRCDCGACKPVIACFLLSGSQKSCGCQRLSNLQNHRANRTTHGESPTGPRPQAEYNTWSHMINRCENSSDEHYPNYGGRGIKVCERWRGSYQAFVADIGRRPSPRHSIDRFDVNGNYEPENCRWATNTEQCRNKRNNRVLEFRGERASVAEWAERMGLKYETLRSRLRKLPTDKALTRPLDPRNGRKSA
jgi:hypothetical protein